MSDYPFTVVLADVAETYSAWQGTVDREKAARMVFRAAVSDARDAGAKLDEIAARLGVTRQAVQKVLREVRREAEEREEMGRMLERQVDRQIREERAGIGRINCASCGHFKSRPESICTWCGDEPGTHNGDRWEVNEAHYGHRVL